MVLIKSNNKKKHTILFVSSKSNYFVNNCASFSRLFNNLKFFHAHPKFKVIVLQPVQEKRLENKKLKKGIKCFYFKALRIMGLDLFPFIDFNPYFIIKAIHIFKKYKIDLIHVDYPYGIFSLNLISSCPIAYNSYNVEYYYSKHLGKYHSFLPNGISHFYPYLIYIIEKLTVKSSQVINTVSFIDKKIMKYTYKISDLKLLVNPFGYSNNVYSGLRDKIEARKRLKLESEKFIIIFHGANFKNYENRKAILMILNEIIPKIRNERVLFLIAGDMLNFKSSKYIKFLGFVDDLNDFLYSADIAIAPIFKGSGVNVKIIDYLSARIPIITTPSGAEGLNFKDNIHGYIVNNSAKNFLEKIYFLKENPEKIKFFKKNIEDLILTHYQWNIILKEVAIRYQNVINLFKGR